MRLHVLLGLVLLVSCGDVTLATAQTIFPQDYSVPQQALPAYQPRVVPEAIVRKFGEFDSSFGTNSNEYTTRLIGPLSLRSFTTTSRGGPNGQLTSRVHSNVVLDFGNGRELEFAGHGIGFRLRF